MDAVVHPVRATGQSRRTADERLYVRYPQVYGLLARAAFTLPRNSQLRRRVITREFESGWAAISRHDYAVMLARYRPDVEFHMAPRWLETADFEPVTYGHQGLVDAINALTDVFPEWTFAPRLVVDLGRRFVTLGWMQLGGRSSGMHMDIPFGQVIQTRGGFVAREDDFNDFHEALAAAGVARDRAEAIVRELELGGRDSRQPAA